MSEAMQNVTLDRLAKHKRTSDIKERHKLRCENKIGNLRIQIFVWTYLKYIRL